MRLFLAFFIFLVLLTSPVHALPTENIEQEQLFLIKADESDYNEKKGYLIASGNVSLVSDQTITEANHIFYDLDNEILKINKPFIIKNTKVESGKPQDYIKGVSLNYDIKNEEGSAEEVESQIGGIYFKGKNIKFSENKFVVLNSFFTNCPHNKKHYGMQARSLNVYLDAGAAVIRGAVLRLAGIPIFYIPNYVYGRLQESTKSQTPVPEVRSDQVRGVYIKEKMGYHFGNLFTGTFNLEWSKKLGWAIGANNSYKINDRAYGDFRLNYVVNSGLEGGFKSNFILWKNNFKPGAEKEEPKHKKGIFNKFFISFLPDISKGEINLFFEASHQELINFRRVSYLPELEMSLRDIIIPISNTQIKFTLGIGNIEEENVLKTKRSFILGEIKQILIPAKYLDFSTALNYDYYWYGQGSFWKKLSGQVNLGKTSKYISLNTGYLKLFKNLGASPFNFDKYQAIINDEIYLGADLGPDSSKIGINFYYDLGRRNYRYKEYHIVLGLCKWRLKVAWEAVERNVGVSLTLSN